MEQSKLQAIIVGILTVKDELGVIQWTLNSAGYIATFHHVQVSIPLSTDPHLFWTLSGFSILIFATSGKYQNKEKTLKRQRRLELLIH